MLSPAALELRLLTPAKLELQMLANVAAFASDWQAAGLVPNVIDLMREFSRGYGRTMALDVLPSPSAAAVPETSTSTSAISTTSSPTTSAAPTASSTTSMGTSSSSSQDGCVELVVKSAGTLDGNLAEFYIDGTQVALASGRGFSIVVLDEDGRVSETHVFDTGYQASGSAPLASLLNSLPEGVGVMISVMDDASDNLTLAAKEAIKGLGALQIDDLAYRGSYALIGVKGRSAVAEKLSASGDGPVQLSGRNVWKAECAETTSSLSAVTVGDPISLRVRSAGAADGNFVEFYVNDALIDLAPLVPARGLTVVSLQDNGQAQEKFGFDTGYQGLGSDPLAKYLQDLPQGTMVMVASMDDATDNLTEEAKVAIESLGATEIRNLAYRGSYALIGVKGGAAMAEGHSVPGNGPVDIVSTWIPGCLTCKLLRACLRVQEQRFSTVA